MNIRKTLREIISFLVKGHGVIYDVFMSKYLDTNGNIEIKTHSAQEDVMGILKLRCFPPKRMLFSPVYLNVILSAMSFLC